MSKTPLLGYNIGHSSYFVSNIVSIFVIPCWGIKFIVCIELPCSVSILYDVCFCLRLKILHAYDDNNAYFFIFVSQEPQRKFFFLTKLTYLPFPKHNFKRY